jgi:hypothetical protein
MTLNKAIKHLRTVRARLNDQLNLASRSSWTFELRQADGFRKEIEAIDYAIEQLESLDQLRKLIFETTIDETKGGRNETLEK